MLLPHVAAELCNDTNSISIHSNSSLRSLLILIIKWKFSHSIFDWFDCPANLPYWAPIFTFPQAQNSHQYKSLTEFHLPYQSLIENAAEINNHKGWHFNNHYFPPKSSIDLYTLVITFPVLISVKNNLHELSKLTFTGSQLPISTTCANIRWSAEFVGGVVLYCRWSFLWSFAVCKWCQVINGWLDVDISMIFPFF